MRRISLLVALFVASSAFAEVKKFGDPLTPKVKTTALSEIVSKPELGATVRVQGSIQKVCDARGCWLEIEDGEAKVHVAFADYAFFLPKDSARMQCTLEGKVKADLPDPSNVTHLSSDGASPARGIFIEATGLEVELPSAADAGQAQPNKG